MTIRTCEFFCDSVSCGRAAGGGWAGFGSTATAVLFAAGDAAGSTSFAAGDRVSLCAVGAESGAGATGVEGGAAAIGVGADAVGATFVGTGAFGEIIAMTLAGKSATPKRSTAK
ncbi:MAG TPA: hypothetical protein VGA88_01425 [Burkholderiales bacterium]